MKHKLLSVILLSLFVNVGFAQQKTGCQSGDCGNGKGAFLFPNGDKYEGDFVDFHLNGFGKYIDARGNIYIGNFKNDKFNGKGMFTRSDGTKYIGEFVDGRRNGLGTQWYSETYKEKGKWENDRFIETAEFEDFVIEESYDFCTEFLKIYNASVSRFATVKGKQVSEYIADSYYCTVKIKELSTAEINDKDGYCGIYYKGDKTEGLKKLEELNKLMLKCTQNSCCTFQNKFSNGVSEKIYEFIPLTVTSLCNSDLLKVKIRILCKVQGTQVVVSLQVSNP